jgi:carbon-monoxide dehydrogenase medium subunit
MLPEFELVRPRALSEALALLAEYGADALPVAGGTNVVVDLRNGGYRPEVLVDIGRLAELRGIRRDDGHVIVGAGTTISELLNSPLIAEHAAILRQAAAVFANPLIRNRATIGGNLADASPAADTAPPLLALAAEVELASTSGTRRVPLNDFLVGVRQTLRRPDELLTAIRWPAPPAFRSWEEQVFSPQLWKVRGAYYKIGLRKADAISVLSAAVMVERDVAGLCRRAAIALGAVAPRPFRATEAEATLVGQPLTSDVIAEAARLAAAATRPISDIRGSANYRRRVTEVVVRRLLAQAA